MSYGDSFQINASPADRIERVALMRCGSATHAWMVISAMSACRSPTPITE
nr:hypothetical protein [Marinobacter sp. AC-23]